MRGAQLDGRSDIYSVGIVLYEMVTGTRPIDGDSSWAVMNAHVNQIPRAPTSINQGLPPALSLTILKALEKDPAARFQNARDFADTLQSLRNRLSVHHQPPNYEVLTQVAPTPSTPLPVPPPVAPSTSSKTVQFDTEGLDRLTERTGCLCWATGARACEARIEKSAKLAATI